VQERNENDEFERAKTIMSLSDKLNYMEKEYKYTSARSKKKGEVRKYRYPRNVSVKELRKCLKELLIYLLHPDYCLNNEHSGNANNCKDCVKEKFIEIFGEKLMK
jgi:hypothetical protein